MSAVTAIEQREAQKRRDIEDRVAELRAKHAGAMRELEGARATLLENPDDVGAKAVAADAQTLADAYSQKIHQLGRDARRLQAFGDDSERKRHAAKLDEMRLSYAARREEQSRRAAELGAVIGELVVAAYRELREMATAEQSACREAKSLAAFLDPTLTAHELVGLGLGESGYDGLRRRAREAMLRATTPAGLTREELRRLFDL